MSLEVKNRIPKIGLIIKVIILIVITIIVVRLSVWEHDYYNRMEGTERMVPHSSGDISSDSTNIDETEINNQQVSEHIVEPNKPRFMSIEKLNIKHARIFSVQETFSGAIQVPSNIFDVGWYAASSVPGENGTSIFDGHNGGPTKHGVFKNLPLLSSGDIITIEMGDGRLLTYRVYDNQTFSLREANSKMKMAQTSPIANMESISIISCTGEWSDLQKTYLSRQFLRATRI